MAHILIVDDEKNYRVVLTRLLEGEGHRVSAVENPFAALELLQREEIALILSDLRMPKMDGLEFFRTVHADHDDMPFVMMTAFATVETALQAIKGGAFDYLTKPFKNEEILVVVNKALEYLRLRRENHLLRRQLEAASGRELIGRSAAIKSLLADVARVGPAPTSVLITGESGTGKELVARALHHASRRHSGSLVCINCATFAENLLESELFGHERGAFTGATERKRGLLEMADGGTLFLDEIGEMSLNLQPKLLRLLQEKRFRRLGGTSEIDCDVRVVAATNRNLSESMAAGTFRDDLYYRLNVVTLHLPALRERVEDIDLLALYFLNRYARELGRPVNSFAEQTLRLLQGYSWPGNVRELQNIIERGVLFCRGEQLRPEDLPASLRKESENVRPLAAYASGFDKPLPERLEEIEEEMVRQALVAASGIQARAARLLGISRSNLQYKLRKFGLMDD